ncbi:non-ribosomal peptide synthetase [Saccharothrix australiensis]|uniref:Amino acid adenylation domain-containing protein/thioester reductase-like protein n=1 Tax=Saccharothrix australiensis TaxID=2072 RepID=A0A495W8P4_9PSEU|nr:amino acid adenylation domain-containing protein [Saccharothrix australiensis]RKT56138.1 amino acid adenylation domain-containing protein/thioester reductase-like protein [Saccharothrix australiensis]
MEPPEAAVVATDRGAARTAASGPATDTVHGLFDARAAAAPDATAATHGGRRLSYGEVRRRSDALAARLCRSGVVRGDRVGVVGARGLDAPVAFLGVLKAGAAYVPLDDTAPPARQQAMADDAGVHTVVTLPGSTCRVRRLRTRVPVDEARPDPPAEAVRPPGVTADDCAYVMFTSGSTGRPKPVAVPHRGVVALARSDLVGQRPRPGDRVLHGYALSSDASTIEVWPPLLNGACLVPVDRADLLSPDALERVLRAEGVAIAYLTTGVFHHVARVRPAALRALRFVSAGGEAMDPELARTVLSACPGTAVVNFYGPTENTVVTTAYDVRRLPADATAVPIGRPLEHCSCHVVRADGTPAGVGEEGDLLVGGAGLALGYLGDPALTGRRFRSSPVEPGAVLYDTGDRVVRLATGDLEYRGRADRQVKLRGHRIELDGVEARIRAHADVGEAVVELSGGTLVGYVTPARPGAGVRVDLVRRDLATWLPPSAVPSRLVELPAFPVNGAGKVDRGRLRALLADRPAAVPATVPAPRGDGPRETVTAVWQAVLRVPVGEADDFFALGGDSLLAAEVVNRTLTAFGVDARHGSALIRELLDDPTPAGFTAAVRRAVERPRTPDRAGPAVDFTAEAELGFRLPRRQGPPPRVHDPRHVLLTGASGFIGAFLLDRLLRRTGAEVHCPVRARDRGHATRRVRANLARYGLGGDHAADRVTCFPADLGRPLLGLDARHAADLARRLDLVVHAGARVNFLYPYRALRSVNVDGTREVVRLAAPRRVPVHFLSTIAVVAGFGTAGVRHVAEDRPLDHADRLTMGYAESKWVAERLLRDAADQGLPVAVYRPYEVTGDQAGGECNTETAICSLIRVVADTGLAPDIPLPLDFVPVDHVSDAIVHIATSGTPDHRTYHLTNPRPATFADLLDRMRAAGYDITTLPYPEWVGELVRHVEADPTSPTAPFVPLCVDRGHKADISVKEMYFEGTFPVLGRSAVEAALADSGLRCPPVDDELLDRYLDYFFASGYLTRPDGGAVRGTAAAGDAVGGTR